MKMRLPCPWLDESNSTALGRAIARRAHVDIGILETTGYNRGTRIDEYNEAAGSPLGSSYCATSVSAWYRESGADTPGKYKEGSCDEWLRWAKREGLWHRTPIIGAAALYGAGDDARHIDVVVRIQPKILIVGANTSWSGYAADANAFTMKPQPINNLLGFVHPRARS